MSATWQRELDLRIDGLFDEIVGLRRHLHAHPEVSGEEHQTSMLLYQRLGDRHFDVRLGPEGRGVVADLRAPAPGELPRVALRGDIDALRIHDAKCVPYRSRCDGVMHACGHDAHTALVYGAAVALSQLQREGGLPWPIRLRTLFQPAEETCRGARELIEVGALDNVSAILATHMDPSRRLGQIGFRDGVLTANCDEMHVHIQGRGGHAARPHEASDPIAAAAQLINALYLLIPRATDSQDAVVVTIGQLHGGETANVIPEEVRLSGTVRTLDLEVRKRTRDHIQRLAEGIGQISDTRIDVRYGIGSQAVVNDGGLNQLLRRATREVLGDGGIAEIPRPSMGSEDFAFYLDHVPGAMIRIGCTSSKAGGSALHTPTFDIDEEALRIAARVLARTVVFWCDPQYHASDVGYA